MMKYNSKDNYFLKGKQYETWKGIKRFNYYRLTEDYVNGAIKAGLSIKCLIEPKPKLSKKEEDMTNIKYPHFLILELAK